MTWHDRDEDLAWKLGLTTAPDDNLI